MFSHTNLIRRAILAFVLIVGVVAAFTHAPWDTGAINVQSASYQVKPSDCGKTVQITGGFYAFTLPSAAAFREGCSIIVKNGDRWSGGRGKELAGFPAGFSNGQNILWPTQAGSVQVINGAWGYLMRPGRPKLPNGRVDFYSDYASGNDAANDCLAPGKSACQSAAHALYLSCDEFDFSSAAQTRMYVNMAANTADRSVIHYACASTPGGQGGAQLVLNGGANSQLSASGLDAIGVFVNATLAVVNVIISTDKGDCLRADYGGQIFFAGGVFGDCAVADMAARNNGRIYIQGDYSIKGNAAYHIYESNGGAIGPDPAGKAITVTLGENATISDWSAEVRSGTVNAPNLIKSPGSFTLSVN
jgi:hypothetical protein